MKNRFCKGAGFSAALALMILALSFLASLVFGTHTLSAGDFFTAITDAHSTAHTIVFSLRLPRAILACISGAMLAASGGAFQMLFRNSLAEPGIMGISAGATLGAVVAQILGVSSILFGTISPINIFAFAGALLAGAVITFISGRAGTVGGGVTLLLCGAALGTFYSSVSSIIILTKSKELHGIYTWILGSFNGRGWNEVRFLVIPAAVSLTLLFLSANKLDLMAGGEQTAKALGLETRQLRTVILAAAALAVSVSVCAGGTINFAGLIAPHIVRRIYGTRGRTLIPLSCVYGMILLLLSDTIARTALSPAELPAGLVTSLLGAPFFLSLIFSGRSRGVSQ